MSELSITKPERLKTGQKVVVLSPAGPPEAAMLRRGIRLLKDAGFDAVPGRHVTDRWGYLAGRDEDRAADINDALHNPDIRAIFCIRGGYGTARILPLIDFEALRNDPKIIVGYSDITTLLLAFKHVSGVVTFHGPLIGGQASSWSYEILFNLLTSHNAPFEWPTPPGWNPPDVIVPGTGRGFTIGGCLTLLSTCCGTAIEPDTSRSILFIEEVNEAPYRIDRMLTHLKNCRWFHDPHAVLFGKFSNCTQKASDPEPTLSIEEIILDLFKTASYPVVTGLPFGHHFHHITIPTGVEFAVENQRIIQLVPAVS